MASSQDIAVAAIDYHRVLREAFIDLRGMKAYLFRVESGKTNDRYDMYGDISNKLTYETPEPVSLVTDIQGVFRMVSQVDSGTDEFLVPIDAEVKLGLRIAEGDMIRFSNYHDVVLEDKFFTVARVEQFVHVRPISRTIKLTQYRGQIDGLTEATGD